MKSQMLIVRPGMNLVSVQESGPEVVSPEIETGHDSRLIKYFVNSHLDDMINSCPSYIRSPSRGESPVKWLAGKKAK